MKNTVFETFWTIRFRKGTLKTILKSIFHYILILHSDWLTRFLAANQIAFKQHSKFYAENLFVKMRTRLNVLACSETSIQLIIEGAKLILVELLTPLAENQAMLLLTSVTRFGDFCTLGNFLKPLATITLLKSPTVLGNFCKGVKMDHFSTEIIFGKLL